jgi:hypothetical protein
MCVPVEQEKIQEIIQLEISRSVKQLVYITQYLIFKFSVWIWNLIS